jgi:hypothetical protein
VLVAPTLMEPNRASSGDSAKRQLAPGSSSVNAPGGKVPKDLLRL